MPSQVDLSDLTKDEPTEDPKRERTRTASSRSREKAEKDLRDRLYGCFERIANSLDERGDQELAEILREDAGIMAQGLVSLTKPFMVLRAPLLVVIAIVEPVMAFGRVVRVMAWRLRQHRYEAQQTAETESVEDQHVQ